MIFLLLSLFGLFAWFFSTIAAGGAATLLIPVITFLLGAQMVAPTITVAALFANPSRAILFRNNIDWQVIRCLLPGSIIGAVMGSWSLAQSNIQIIQIMLGLFLITYVLQDKFSNANLTAKITLIWFFPLGLTASFLSGLVGATGPVHNPFMQSYGLEKECLVGTKAINSLVMQVTKLFSYGVFGALNVQNAGFGIALGLGAIVGVFLARTQLSRIDSQRFKQYTLIVMFISGIAMLYKAI